MDDYNFNLSPNPNPNPYTQTHTHQKKIKLGISNYREKIRLAHTQIHATLFPRCILLFTSLIVKNTSYSVYSTVIAFDLCFSCIDFVVIIKYNNNNNSNDNTNNNNNKKNNNSNN